MTLPSANRVQPQVLWAQVCALATVQGAIALLWVIYNLYLVDLLTQLGFSRALAAGLLLVENLLAVVMEPLMGSLSDRLQHQIGTRFPLISLGSILAAGIFLALPVVAFQGASAGFRAILPVALVAWALAMTVFRSPALSLLGRYAFGSGLPQAASILTLVGGVAGAMGPLASDVILGWGAPAAFAIGSVILLVATATLRLFGPNEVVPEAVAVRPGSVLGGIAFRRLALVFGAGLGITLGFRLVMTNFSQVANQIPAGRLVVGSIFIALAVSAIPAGMLARQWGNRRTMVSGLGVMALVCVCIAAGPPGVAAVGLALTFGAAFSLVSNGTIPFALSAVPAQKAGLGTGIFFSGGAAAASLFGTISPWLSATSPVVGVILGMAAFLLAGVSINTMPSGQPATK